MRGRMREFVRVMVTYFLQFFYIYLPKLTVRSLPKMVRYINSAKRLKGNEVHAAH